MTLRIYLTAALAALAVFASPVSTVPVNAETLTILHKGTSRNLNVIRNRAVVVESDVPFEGISIANPGIADAQTLTQRTIYLLGKAPGRTTLSLFNGEGQLITNVEVHVTPDLAEFKERLRQILPNEKIEVRTANAGIVLSGTVSNAARMERALELARKYAPDDVSNMMQVSGRQQVMLKVRFAEMQRSVSKALSTSIAIDGIGSVTGHGVGFGSAGLGTGGLGSGDAVSPTGTNSGASFIGFDIGSIEVGILLQALETKGMVRTLAEPNLTALSGQQAEFLAGGEFPIPVPQDGGVTTIEFKRFGVELLFTPYVVDDGVINLEIGAAVSSIDTTTGVSLGDQVVPGLRTRLANTTIAMRDGDSFAIAGLLQDDFRDSNSQVPWLGDIPVLGTLFRSADYQRSQSELVIIVTAHLVSPTRGEALALPTDRVKLPNEKDLFLNGRVAKNVKSSGAIGEVAKQDFNGSYGYVMD
jgi:pilus assembly protein CpaC